MARQRGIGHNPTLDNIYQTNNQNNLYDMAQNSDRYNNYSGTQAWPEYNPNLFAGVGRFDPRNLMRPDNLTQDMGASMYQAGPPQNVNSPLLDTYQRSPHEGFEEMQFSETAQAPQKKSIFERLKGLKTPLMQILKSQRNNPEENFGMDYYGGSLRDGRVNRNPAFNLHGDMNVASGFGAGLGAAGDKRIARIEDTITNLPEQWSNLKEEEEKGLHNKYTEKLARHREKLINFQRQQNEYQTALAGQGGEKEVITDKITETVNGPNVHGGEGNQGGSYQDQGGGYSTQGGFTQATQARPDTGRGHHSWADGGRIGYAGGELVDEDINIQGPGFDVNENMEMAEGPSPFEMRIQELVDTGMSWQEAYQIAAEEFGMAEGQEDSFSEEGIASLV